MTTADIVNVPNALTPEVNTDQPSIEEAESSMTFETNSSTIAEGLLTEAKVNRLNALASLVRNKLKPGLSKPLQNELSRLLRLIPELDNPYHEEYIPLVEIAVQSLLFEKPNISLAKGIRKDIEYRVHRSPIAMIMQGGTPAAQVILGLGTLLFLVIPLLVLAVSFLPPLLEVLLTEKELTAFSKDSISLALFVALTGAVGSAISIMVRIQDFEELKNTDPSILFLTGLFKPIIGSAFALFVFATLNAGLLPAIEVNPEQTYYFYAALAFVSGFSERFARDLVTQAEGMIVSVQSTKQ